jgi:hypothetical protein
LPEVYPSLSQTPPHRRRHRSAPIEHQTSKPKSENKQTKRTIGRQRNRSIPTNRVALVGQQRRLDNDVRANGLNLRVIKIFKAKIPERATIK